LHWCWGAGTAIRLIAGPVAGRLADILDAPKAVLAACSVAVGIGIETVDGPIHESSHRQGVLRAQPELLSTAVQ
jgi:hypothetical protein